MNNQQYKIAAEEAPVIRQKMKEVEKKGLYRRLLVVALRAEGKTSMEISEITGVHKDTVGQLAKRYVEVGLDAFAQDNRKGGNHRNMSRLEEKEFLSQLEKSAHNGQVITIAEISAAYAAYTGRDEAPRTTVYDLLHRNGWRRIMPRSKHPNKASDEAIEASKKLTTLSETRWENIPILD